MRHCEYKASAARPGVQLAFRSAPDKISLTNGPGRRITPLLRETKHPREVVLRLRAREAALRLPAREVELCLWQENPLHFRVRDTPLRLLARENNSTLE